MASIFYLFIYFFVIFFRRIHSLSATLQELDMYFMKDFFV